MDPDETIIVWESWIETTPDGYIAHARGTASNGHVLVSRSEPVPTREDAEAVNEDFKEGIKSVLETIAGTKIETLRGTGEEN